MKVELNQHELEEHLKEQLSFIECSANAYDNGFEGEIKRLAVSVRVLVHDTNKSTSLLTLLDKKTTLYFDKSIPFDENNLQSHSGLVQIHLGNKATVLPLLDGGPFTREVSFDSWWNGVVFVDNQRNEFSRKDIVLSLANKEGGAHVDKKIDKKYSDLKKGHSLGLYELDPYGRQTPVSDQIPATMRQIAHEVLKTLKDNYTCEVKTPSGKGLLMMGASMVKGSSAPPIPAHNLPKNRPVVNGKKIGRNDPCNCGSGKKYKKCCIL